MSERCLLMSENVFECHQKSALVGKRLLTSAKRLKCLSLSEMSFSI